MQKWTVEEIEQAVEFLKNGKTYSEIAIILKRTHSSVRGKLQKLGFNYLQEQVVLKMCLNCDKEYSATRLNKKKFCNNSCAATYNNKHREIKIKGECINCGKQKRGEKYIYCSNNCQRAYDKRILFLAIEKGDSTCSARRYKEYLIWKYGEKCMDCDWSQVHSVTNKVPIQLEHIDGNSDNNKLSNLKLLCPNCHSLTPTYGALNKNNGSSRRKNYRKEWRNKEGY
jgi:hypothetical protein